MTRVAYTILANPFTHDRNNPDRPLMNGPLPAASVLQRHLESIASLQPRLLKAVLVVLPTDTTKQEVPGYRNVSADEAQLACPLVDCTCTTTRSARTECISTRRLNAWTV